MNDKEQALELLREAQASLGDCLENLERYIAQTGDSAAKRTIYKVLSEIHNGEGIPDNLLRYVVTFDSLIADLPRHFPPTASEVQEWAIAHLDDYATDERVVCLEALIDDLCHTLKVKFNAEYEFYEVEGVSIGYLVERTFNRLQIEYC